MLTHPTHDRLVALGLTGMAKALEEQRKQPDVAVGLILRRPVNAPAGLLCGFGPHVLPPRAAANAVSSPSDCRRCRLTTLLFIRVILLSFFSERENTPFVPTKTQKTCSCHAVAGFLLFW
jgi:hypothetical protein